MKPFAPASSGSRDGCREMEGGVSRHARFARFLLALSLLAVSATADEREKKALSPPSTDSSQQGTTAKQGASFPFLRQIGRDFGDVFTHQGNWLVLGVGGGATWAASHYDDEIANGGFNSELNGGTGLDNVFDSGEILGGALAQFGGAAATWGVGKLASSPGVTALGRDLVRAQIVTGALTFGLKRTVGRERPDGSNRRSFPSGHTSGSFATATVLHRSYGWKVGVPAYAVAGYIGASRLNEAKHYLSDVVFGATVGFLVGRSLTLELASSRLQIAPMAAAGGFGVQMRWVGTGVHVVEATSSGRNGRRRAE